MVVDCGGGTVDLTVHQIRLPEGHLKELYKASGKSLAEDEFFAVSFYFILQITILSFLSVDLIVPFCGCFVSLQINITRTAK